MANRYSGQLRISVEYDDRGGDYRVGVTDGKHRWRGRIRPAPAGFGPGVGYDSPKAYDSIARSALAFASDEMGDLGEVAATTESGYHVGRTPATAWGSGRDRASRRTARRGPASPRRKKRRSSKRASTRRTPRRDKRRGGMTLAQAQEKLRAMGYQIRKYDGEYQVKPSGRGSWATGELVDYSHDLDDAIDTAAANMPATRVFGGGSSPPRRDPARVAKLKGRPRVMYAMAANEDGHEVHVAMPDDKRAVVALEKAGLVEVRRTKDRIAGYTEWWYRLAGAPKPGRDPARARGRRAGARARSTRARGRR